MRPHLWPAAPIVFAGVEQSLARLSIPPNVTGIVYGFRLPNVLTAARALAPNLKRIAIVGDPLEKQTNRRHFIQELPTLAAGLEVIDVTGLAMDDLTQRLQDLPNDTVVIYTAIYVDGGGTAYTPAEALSIVAKASIRPVVVDAESYIGHGATGGLVVAPAPVGRELARLTLRVLSGENPSTIPVSSGDVIQPVFDWGQLQRFGISESSLPPGSEIRFRVPTAWEQYRLQVILAVVAVAIQSLLIAGLLYQRRRRYAAEVEARRQMGELALMNRRSAIGEMSASIAHEIRQPLSAIVTNSDVGLRWLAKQTPNADEAAAALKRIVADAYRANKVVESIRGMFTKGEQGRALIDVNDVIREVLALLRIEIEEHEVAVRTALSDGAPRVLADRIQLQQVFFNLARNAVEAMDAVTGRPRVLKLGSAATESGQFIVTIEDSGPGIAPDILGRLFDPFVTTKSNGMGMGLSICRSIIEAHGGRLSVAPAGPNGATFEIALPLP